jgi:hypothetical protein
MNFRTCKLDECGNQFKPHVANLKRGHGKFCSTKCWARYRHNQSLVTKTCNVCKAVFKGKKKRKVCSKKCGTRWMVISRKQRTTYRKKLIIGNLSKTEASVIRNLRKMPEMMPKVVEILGARSIALQAFGIYTRKGLKNE